MKFTLLCNLGAPRNVAVSLRLRLLHVWPAKSPGDIRIYNYCTLWTDETGMLIHGVSTTSMAAGIRRNLSVGKIYLNTRAGNHCYLTDVVGRLHSISGISHKITNNGPAVKQTVIIEDERFLRFSRVSEFSRIEAVILAFGGFLVNKLGDDYILSSSAGTRIAVNPPVPKAYFLASRFVEKHEVVESLPVEFATAADATADADRRTKTLDQLLSLSRMNSSLEERYRCGGVIVDVESNWQLDEEQTQVNYKLKLALRDDSCEARFILMGGGGGCALALVNVSAAHLAQRFPHRPVVPLDDPTVVGHLLEYSSQPSLSCPVVAVPSLAMCAAGNAGVSSSSSRAAKEKEKVSGPLLIEASAVPFSIIGEPDQTVSSIAEDLQIPIPANIEREDMVVGSQILGGSHFSRVGVKVGSSPAAAVVPVPSSVQSCAPFARSTPPMISKRTSRIDESMSPEDVSHGSFTSAAKVLKPSPGSSPGKTSGLVAGSPSASLLVSPLAKIKVEKLDAAEIAPLPHGGSSQAGVDTERGSPVDSQKNPTVKLNDSGHVLFLLLLCSNASQEKKDSVSNSNTIFKAKKIALPDSETVGVQKYNLGYLFPETRGTRFGGWM
ncbi:unnamed protein product [Linum trigynum]|uniref:Uncharacterized protein n=1 Tax=Linum trigynum TaxID=586398 RepID=A0AAV2D956_9ROSI